MHGPVTIASFAVDTNLPEDDECRLVLEFDRCTSLDARQRANKALRTHKWPMALYWKCVAVYSGHIARMLK